MILSSVSFSRGITVQTRLNGSRSSLGWRFLRAQGTRRICDIYDFFAVPFFTTYSMRPSPNYLSNCCNVQLLQSLPSALVSPTSQLQTILISPQAVTKPVAQTVTVASSPATSVITVAPSGGAGVALGTVAAVPACQPTSEQYPPFRIPEVC